MRLNRNFSWCALIALALTSAGCGGISASKSISPASFFLPGLLKNETACTNSVPFAQLKNSREAANDLASVR